jgi:hypothetical protein
MINLLEETIRDLKLNGKSPEDVCFVIFRGKSNEKIMSKWDEFSSLSNFEYDDGYGWQEISSSINIVGDDWWMERGEYDGAEWWEFKSLPKADKCIYRAITKEDILEGYDDGSVD